MPQMNWDASLCLNDSHCVFAIRMAPHLVGIYTMLKLKWNKLADHEAWIRFANVHQVHLYIIASLVKGQKFMWARVALQLMRTHHYRITLGFGIRPSTNTVKIYHHINENQIFRPNKLNFQFIRLLNFSKPMRNAAF